MAAAVALSMCAIAAGSMPTRAQSAAFHPAKYRSGDAPAMPPPTVVGGGEVMVELDVTSAGVVRGARALRSTSPYTDALIAAVKTWRFQAAEVEAADPSAAPGAPRWKPVDATVLVGEIVTAPALNNPTLGELPKDVGAESDATPFPFSTSVPLFPPRARDAGLVMMEATIDVTGGVRDSRIVHSNPPFDDAALATLKGWRFRPARVGGASVPVYAYFIFGFRQPTTGVASLR
jgi:TonB family protein